jgi:hypothetical protein
MVLQLRTAIQYRDGTLAAIVPRVAGNDRAAEVGVRSRRLAAERALDEVLADSFPASDPPSWNQGIARPEPIGYSTSETLLDESAVDEGPAVRGGVIDVSRPTSSERTLMDHALISVSAAAGIAFLVVVTMLLIGLPIALLVRGLIEAGGWVFTLIYG